MPWYSSQPSSIAFLNNRGHTGAWQELRASWFLAVTFEFLTVARKSLNMEHQYHLLVRHTTPFGFCETFAPFSLPMRKALKINLPRDHKMEAEEINDFGNDREKKEFLLSFHSTCSLDYFWTLASLLFQQQLLHRSVRVTVDRAAPSNLMRTRLNRPSHTAPFQHYRPLPSTNTARIIRDYYASKYSFL